jgi:hypothetical protein
MAIPPPPAPSWAPQQEGVAQIVQLLTEYRQPGANQQQVSTHPTPSTRRMHHPPLRQDPRLVHNLRIIRDLGEFATPFKRPAAPYRGAVHAARGNRTAPRRAGGPPVHLRAYAGSVVAPPLSSKSRHHVNSEMYTVGKRIFSDSAAVRPLPAPPRPRAATDVPAPAAVRHHPGLQQLPGRSTPGSVTTHRSVPSSVCHTYSCVLFPTGLCRFS